MARPRLTAGRSWRWTQKVRVLARLRPYGTISNKGWRIMAERPSMEGLQIVRKGETELTVTQPTVTQPTRESVQGPEAVPRSVLTCRLPVPLLDRLADAAHHYRKRHQKQDLIEQALDMWLKSKGF